MITKVNTMIHAIEVIHPPEDTKPLDWYKTLDAYEGMFGVPNVIREKGFTEARAFYMNWGHPRNHYKGDDLGRLIGFADGFNGNEVNPGLLLRVRSYFSSDVANRIKLVEEGNECGFKAAGLKQPKRTSLLPHLVAAALAAWTIAYAARPPVGNIGLKQWDSYPYVTIESEPASLRSRKNVADLKITINSSELYHGPIFKDDEYVVPDLERLLHRCGVLKTGRRHPDSLDPVDVSVTKDVKSVSVQYALIPKHVRDSNEKDNQIGFSLDWTELEQLSWKLWNTYRAETEIRKQKNDEWQKIKDLEIRGYKVTRE